MQQCIDEKTDDLMKKGIGETQKTQCSKNDLRKEGDKIVAESVCKMQNSTATTRAVFSGRFDAAYQADIAKLDVVVLSAFPGWGSSQKTTWRSIVSGSSRSGNNAEHHDPAAITRRSAR